MNSQLVEVASWRLLSELFRRYPLKYKLIETHPGGGMYDCLSIFCDQKHIADFNRAGSFHVVHNPNAVPALDIWRLMVEEDVQSVLNQVCRRLALKIPGKLPPSTPEVIVYRFIAAFLAHAAFGKEKWECRNGLFDTSGMDACNISPAFSVFPAAENRVRTVLPGDLHQEPAYRFWFILHDGNPVMCFETTGTVWNLDGQSFDLFKLYKKEKRIWPMVLAVAGVNRHTTLTPDRRRTMTHLHR